jgi:hypothetical protein
MCRADWAAVPMSLQRNVWATWGRFQGCKQPAQALNLLADYRQAADAATEYVAALKQDTDSPTTKPNTTPQPTTKDTQ